MGRAQCYSSDPQGPRGNLGLNYPEISGTLFSLGPIAIRWYGLAYLAAFFMVWWLGNRRATLPLFKGRSPTQEQMWDLVFYGAVGTVLGGRIGYGLFYGMDQLLADPIWLIRFWDGGLSGLSFHGGMLGVCVGIWLWSRRTKLSFLQCADFLAPLVPIGLGLGRLGNFANTELPGRVSESGFGLHYPCYAVMDLNPSCQGAFEAVARHPSSLYQAFAEGLVLFAILWWYSSAPRITGQVSAVFLMAYGIVRVCTEFFREPDAGIGFLFGLGITMGQSLSIAMILAGGSLYWHALRNRDAAVS